MKVAVNHEAVASAIAQLALATHRMKRELDRLDDEVGRLRSSWSGEAQQAYDRSHERWSAAIRAMNDALAGATRRLITADAISRETSSAAASLWRR